MIFFFFPQDDGELYDEFGNLKKKFRAKTQQSEAARVLPGSGRAGWEVEDLGNVCIFGIICHLYISYRASGSCICGLVTQAL